MMLNTFIALAAVQFGQQQQNQPPSPIADLVVTPSGAVLTPGDTVRLRAEARDSSGRAIDNVRVRFFLRFEGSVDSTGLVTAGSPGNLAVTAFAVVPGTRPFYKSIPVKVIPGPATRVDVTPAVKRLAVGQRLRLSATSYSKEGDPRDDRASWTSSNPAVARVDGNGVVTGVATGRASITATVGAARGKIDLDVPAARVASVEIRPRESNAKQGDVIRFTARALDAAGKEIAGLVPAWSFSPGEGMIDQDGAFVGYDAGDYLVTASFGRASGQAPVTLDHRDVRRPAQVVGRLPRTLFGTEEVWVHPNGKIAYLGTSGGGDRMYAIDISDPSKPVVTDSVVANTRRVNDIMTTPDGKFLVFTREGAADRKNGLVICSLEDPAHPKAIAEFTDGVTAGVHSAFVYRQEKYGTHVFLTNDGTGAMHVLDIGDPYHPKEVAQWRTTNRPEAGRTLHDIDIQDGLAYLSYWNDGLVILDVGNGMAGGSPSNPQMVSQYKYDLTTLYRDVEARHGPGYIRGTHTAWRHKNYVIIADEVFPAGSVEGAKDASAGRAFGRLQVLDVSDLKHPRSVAWYEPEYGGVHNVWVAGDTLYLGAYNGGFHAFDISGELRGDLRAQQREIVHVHTGDMDAVDGGKNTPMTWGVVVKGDLAYVNDINSGLWIVRIKPRLAPPVP
jgi:hypothetical protein